MREQLSSISVMGEENTTIMITYKYHGDMTRCEEVRQGQIIACTENSLEVYSPAEYRLAFQEYENEEDKSPLNIAKERRKYLEKGSQIYSTGCFLIWNRNTFELVSLEEASYIDGKKVFFDDDNVTSTGEPRPYIKV